jgi:hypothetical protein
VKNFAAVKAERNAKIVKELPTFSTSGAHFSVKSDGDYQKK